MSPASAFIDPICGMSVGQDAPYRVSAPGGGNAYFCSRACAERYAAERGLSACCIQAQDLPWYRHRTALSVLGLAAVTAAAAQFPATRPFAHNVVSYLREVWWAILFGFLLGGVIERYVPREYVASLLTAGRKRSVVYSTLLGLVMSACSHGILAIAVELYRKGASTPVVVSFLLASPWANLSITLLLISLFGAKAFFIIFGALAVAIVTGLAFQALEGRGWVETNPSRLVVREGFSLAVDVRRRLGAFRPTPVSLRADAAVILRGAVMLADRVLWWLLLGIALSSLAAAFIPHGFFQRYMGPTLPGLATTLGLATVIEVCSEGTAPLAFELHRQTGAFGNAFVFLMAGVVTDYTEIALLWSNIGRRTALWLPAVAVPQVLALGWLANRIF